MRFRWILDAEICLGNIFMNSRQHRIHHCPGVTRRSFLADTGMGFTGLALGVILFDHNHFVSAGGQE
jgi:hypothetical protein